MAHYYLPLGGIIIAVVMLIWIVIVAWTTQREGMAYSELSRWADTPMTLPTDSVVGPRVEAQGPAIQVANGGGRRLWIEWEAAPAYRSVPFYPDGYAGEPHILKTRKGGRIQIEPGQYVFFPVKKTRIEGIRMAPLMGCDLAQDGEETECRVGVAPVAPYFQFSFSPPESRARDAALISAETGTTLPFTFSYFSREADAVTTMACSLPPAECPAEFRISNANKKFGGCAGGGEGYHKLLEQNCLVTQSPEAQSVGTAMFDRDGIREMYMGSSADNRFKLTFYDTGFEWI